MRAAAACQAKLGDDDGYYRALQRLLQHYPSKAYWADAIARLQRLSGFSDRLLLDSFRLMRHVGVLEDPQDLMSTAQLAVEASLPGEARAVLQAGFDAGLLGKGPEAAAQQALMNRAQRLAQADQAQLDEAISQAQRQADGRALFLLGQAAISYGQRERGLGLMEAALGRGSPSTPMRRGCAWRWPCRWQAVRPRPTGCSRPCPSAMGWPTWPVCGCWPCAEGAGMLAPSLQHRLLGDHLCEVLRSGAAAQADAATWMPFERRLRRHVGELSNALAALYGGREDFMGVMERVALTAWGGWCARPQVWRERDLRREERPDWFWTSRWWVRCVTPTCGLAAWPA